MNETELLSRVIIDLSEVPSIVVYIHWSARLKDFRQKRFHVRLYCISHSGGAGFTLRVSDFGFVQVIIMYFSLCPQREEFEV